MRPTYLSFCSLGGIRGDMEDDRPYPSVGPSFLFLMEGEGFVQLRGKWFHVRAGEGLFVPNNCPLFPHGRTDESIPTSHWLWIGIHPFGAAVHHCRLTPHAHYHSPVYVVVDERLPHLLCEWETETRIRERKGSLVSQGLLLGLFSLLEEAAGLPLIAWAELMVSLPPLPTELRRIVGYILRTYDRPFRADRVARFYGVSPPHLRRQFQRYLRLSPSTFVTQVRL